jgi:hypothetical protein
MTPAEQLREAARLMRERVRAATDGPWTAGEAVEIPAVGDGFDRWQIPVSGPELVGEDGERIKLGICTVEYEAGGFQYPHADARADGDYIVSMQPPVGAAFADLLDLIAQRWIGADIGFYPARREFQNTALAVARAYLGVTDD